MSYTFNIGPVDLPHDTFDNDMTYNLSPMLKRAGFHPNLTDGMTVEQLRLVVWNAVRIMEDHASYFRTLNPENWWGSYEDALKFLTELMGYLDEAPDDYVMRVS